MCQTRRAYLAILADFAIYRAIPPHSLYLPHTRKNRTWLAGFSLKYLANLRQFPA